MDIFGRFSSSNSKAAMRLAKDLDLLHNSLLLDPVWYRQTNPDLRDTPIDVARHYIEHGAAEGRNPHPLFDTKFYIQQDPDVTVSGANPLVHYILRRIKKRFDPHPLFDTDWYLGQLPVSQRDGVCALEHYLSEGWGRGLSPHPIFDSKWYVEKYSGVDPSAATLPALLHYLSSGKRQGFLPNKFFTFLESIDERQDKGDLNIRSIQTLEKKRFSQVNFPLASIEHSDLNIKSDSLSENSGSFRERISDVSVPEIDKKHQASSQPMPSLESRGLAERQDFPDAGWYLNKFQYSLLERNCRADEIQVMVKSAIGSPFFDLAYYVSEGGRGDDQTEALADYFVRGEALNICPSESFDPSFYRAVYGDVAKTGASLLNHFLTSGQSEGRYPGRSALAADIELLVGENYVNIGILPRNVSDIEKFLLFGELTSILNLQGFDCDFYQTTYSDTSNQFHNPLIHYLRVGRAKRAFRNATDLANAVSVIEPKFDEAYYRKQRPILASNLSPVQDYLLCGVSDLLDPSSNFSTEYYLRRHPDVCESLMQPYVHYVSHGRTEGRRSVSVATEIIRNGKIEPISTKSTVMVAIHESSRTGAPLLGLELVKQLKSKFNIFTYIGQNSDRNLTDLFAEHSCYLATGPLDSLEAEFLLRAVRRNFGVSALVTNSVETHAITVAALYEDLPTVSLLHEFPEYSLPAGKFAEVVACADRVVVPAPLLKVSADAELTWHYGSPSSNVLVRHQGYIEHDVGENNTDIMADDILKILRPGGAHPRIVLGAGSVQPRKGVDLFLQTAAALKSMSGEDVCFIWVGEGYRPNNDINYGIWIKETWSRMDLAKNVFFLPHQMDLSTLFKLADVFFLSSRMDPYPNVLVDALKHGKPVVCFARSTGAEELFDNEQAFGRAVPYADVFAAATAIRELLLAPSIAGEQNRRLVTSKFSFRTYVEFVVDQIEQARSSRQDMISTFKLIRSAGAIDSDFYNGDSMGDLDQRRCIKHFVALASKGLAKYHPRPGLAAQYGLTSQSEAPVLPAMRLLENANPASSHRTSLLRGYITYKPPKGFAALHLHIHYPEMADDFVMRLNNIRMPLDVFVTTTHSTNRDRIENCFRDYRFGERHVIQVQNKGRDIGPLITHVGGLIRARGYEVFGHFHSKKSVELGAEFGRRWHNFLVGTLLGESWDVSQILATFARDDSVGLVFAEDRHVVGWSKNRPFAADLAARLSPQPKIHEHPVFPIGNMFWARVAAFKPLWEADLTDDDFPPEPLPYDGSILHAIERLVPAICESVGYRWETVRKPGLSR